MIRKTFVENSEKPVMRVTFDLPDGVWASAIYLVGDFNEWNRRSHPFQQNRDGTWSLTVDLEVGRAFQFRYLCDCGHWLNERQADAYVVNPYGSDNFVIITDPLFKRNCSGAWHWSGVDPSSDQPLTSAAHLSLSCYVQTTL